MHRSKKGARALTAYWPFQNGSLPRKECQRLSLVYIRLDVCPQYYWSFEASLSHVSVPAFLQNSAHVTYPGAAMG